MTLSLIWAMADNRVIGIENRLPWKLPADMKWFRQNTMGKPIIMGRLTFESFGAKPLPGRRNIIISRNPSYTADGIDVYTSLEDALQSTQSNEETMIIGGMSLYKQALPLADRLYMTLIHANMEGTLGSRSLTCMSGRKQHTVIFRQTKKPSCVQFHYIGQTTGSLIPWANNVMRYLKN